MLTCLSNCLCRSAWFGSELHQIIPKSRYVFTFQRQQGHAAEYVKNCEDKFAEVASSPRFGFFGNVQVGKDLPLTALHENYDAILFAYGASKDRTLGLPGEQLDGVHSARAFVGWYNGLPEFSALAPNLESSDTAVIIGQGNVALDIARVLLCSIDHLSRTDISEEALETLKKSRVKRVKVVGRRGPMQAAFTIKEVRELVQLRGVQFEPIDVDLLPSKDVDLPRAPKRLAQLMFKHSTGVPDPLASRSISLRFLLAPKEFHRQSDSTNSLGSITFQKTTWATEGSRFKKDANVISTDEHLAMDTGLAFRSIGYKAERLLGMNEIGVDFDDRAGRIQNDGGRVLCDGGISRKLYCAGWAKSGPTGVIATTMDDSFATAELIAKDWGSHVSDKKGSEALRDTIGDHVDWSGWQRIDSAERARGEKRGKEREKFRSVKEMLAVA